MDNKGTHNYIEDIRNEYIKIYINGDFHKRKDAKISVFDSGFLLGDGVWEGIRLINGRFIFLDEHLNRLYHGAKTLEIDIGHTKKELKQILEKTMKINNMTDGVHIRLIVSRGLKKTPYQHPNANLTNCSIVIIPEYKISNMIFMNKGIHLVSVKTRRGTENTQNPKLNTLSKHNCIAACIEAKNAGADEGIMLDVNGNVATCNSTNFFIVKNNEIWTSTGEYCLPGITRQAVITICKENNLKNFEKNFIMNDVYSADESFVTGTFSGITPVIKIDSIKISKSKIRPITNKLQKLYEKKIHN